MPPCVENVRRPAPQEPLSDPLFKELRTTDLVTVSRDSAIATVMLNRPEKPNAMTKPMWQGSGEAISKLSGEDGIRCISVRGAGEKSFSPGSQIAEFQTELATDVSYSRHRTPYAPKGFY